MKEDTLITTGVNLARGMELARLLKCLSSVGIEPLVLRGSALVETVYPHPGERLAADIDLLLRPEEVSLVTRTLAQESYSTPPDSTAPHYFKKGEFDHIYHLDLHWDIWYLNESEFRILWKDALSFNLNADPDKMSRRGGMNIGSTKAKTLAPEEHFIYVGMHSLFHHGKLDAVRLQDLITLVKYTPSFDWARLIDKTKLYHLEVPMKVVLDTLQQRTPNIVPAEIFSQLRLKGLINKFWAGLLKRLIQHLPIPNIGHLLKISSIRGIWGKFRYLTDYLFPSGLFMKERYPLLRRYPSLVGWFYLQRPMMLVLNGMKEGVNYLITRIR